MYLKGFLGTLRVPTKGVRQCSIFHSEYALIEFEDAKFSGKIIPELLDLAARGIVRFVDIVFIEKEEDGTTRTLELNDLDPETYEMFVPLGEHVSNFFTNDDLPDRGEQTAR